MAKYPHYVVKDGVWYPAGAEVPEGEAKTETKKPAKAKKKQE